MTPVVLTLIFRDARPRMVVVTPQTAVWLRDWGQRVRSAAEPIDPHLFGVCQQVGGRPLLVCWAKLVRVL